MLGSQDRPREGVGGGLVFGLAWAITTLGLMLCVGCASPGPPLPPSLRLPAKAVKLEAVRVDAEVRLSFTVPLDTTDGERNRGGMTAAVCRAVAAQGCVEIGKVAVVAGEVKYADALPVGLRTGPPLLLRYGVQVMNARGRTAGNGDLVYAAGGEAPTAVRGLTVVARRGAVLVRWQPAGAAAEMEVTRRATNAAVTPERKPAKGRLGFSGLGDAAEKDGVVRLSGGGAADAGGMVDAGVRDREGYVYTAQRVQRVNLAGHALELRGAESGPVAIAYRDVFPPAAPTGLVAVAGGGKTPSIDLVWDASADEGVTGYVVYRLEGQEFRRLAATAVAAYRDLTVTPGVAYRYRVTAVDARGNESAAGAEIQEMVRP